MFVIDVWKKQFVIFWFQLYSQVPLQYYKLRIQLRPSKQLCATSNQFSQRNQILSLLSVSTGNFRRCHHKWFHRAVEAPEYSWHRTFPVFIMPMGMPTTFWYFPTHVCQSSIVSRLHSSSSTSIRLTINRSNPGRLLDSSAKSSIRQFNSSKNRLHETTVCSTGLFLFTLTVF